MFCADNGKCLVRNGSLHMNIQSAVPDGPVRVNVYRPSQTLEGYLTFFYAVEADGPLEDFLYPEWGNVRFARSGAWSVDMPGFYPPGRQERHLFGPTDRPGKVETAGGRLFGFGLTPVGWHRLFGAHAGEMANRVVPLGSRLGISDEELHKWVIEASDDLVLVHCFEELIASLITQGPPIGGSVLAVDRAFRLRPRTVAEFACSAGLTDRTLHRVCLRSFGFAPKRLLRLQRFLDALGHMRSAVGEPIIEALGLAYYDAAHFYHDFRTFMGMTPREYLSAPRPLMAAAAKAQMSAGITLSFELPPTINAASEHTSPNFRLG